MDFKKLTTYVGHLFVLLSFGFLFFVITSLDFSSLTGVFKLYWIPLIMIMAFLFSLLYFFMAEGWRILLVTSSQACLDAHVIHIYLKTVIFKYAPGNVFHFLGRHSLSKSHGLTHKSIAFANVLEIVLQLLAVSFIIMIGTLFFGVSLELGNYITLSKSEIIVVFSLLVLAGLLLLSRPKYRVMMRDKKNWLTIFQVFVYHLVFLLGSALTLVMVYAFLLGVDFTITMFVKTIVISEMAWLVGFVVPGAPGGVGIREAILVLLLPTIMIASKELVLAGALVYRVVSILGEGLTYFWAKLFQKI